MIELIGIERINRSEATSFGRYKGFELFEHPTYGDEFPIVLVHCATGVQYASGAYDVEEAHFVIDEEQNG